MSLKSRTGLMQISLNLSNDCASSTAAPYYPISTLLIIPTHMKVSNFEKPILCFIDICFVFSLIFVFAFNKAYYTRTYANDVCDHNYITTKKLQKPDSNQEYFIRFLLRTVEGV